MSDLILTIAIPTYNRSEHLRKNLEQLFLESRNLNPNSFEVIICDNSSDFNSKKVAIDFQGKFSNFTYVRNEGNIGSDANIAQCFNLADGKYVQILGDDDLYLDKQFARVMNFITANDFGVVFLRAFGYRNNFRTECPQLTSNVSIYDDTNEFLVKLAQNITFISGCIINKSLISDLDAKKFEGAGLVQVHLSLRAALTANKNALFSDYVIAAYRNNSGGYDFSNVFVSELGKIYDQHIDFGLRKDAIRKIENRMLISFIPFYLFRQLIDKTCDTQDNWDKLVRRYGMRWQVILWLAPLLKLPRPVALVWGAAITSIGRILAGDFQRGLKFGNHYLKTKFRSKKSRNL